MLRIALINGGFPLGPDVFRRNITPCIKPGTGLTEPVIGWGQDIEGAMTSGPEDPTLLILWEHGLCWSLISFKYPVSNIV